MIRAVVDIVADLLVRLDSEGRIVRHTKKVYTMMLFGMINYSHTWYDPAKGVMPEQFADLAADVFLEGLIGRADRATAKAARGRSRA